MSNDQVDHLIHICHATGAENWVSSAYVILSLPIFIICGSLYTIYWWDRHLMIVGLGVVFNVALGIIFKEILTIPRRLENCGVGYSMPSSHTFLASFLVTYFSYLLFEASLREERTKEKLRLWLRIILIWIYLFILSYEKVSIGHNTWYDVTMGWVMGIPYGWIFLHLMSRFISGAEEFYVLNEDKTD